MSNITFSVFWMHLIFSYLIDYIYILYSVTYRCVYIYRKKLSYLLFINRKTSSPEFLFENSEMPPRWPTPRPRLWHLEDLKPQRDHPGCKASPTQDDSLVVSTNPILEKYCCSHINDHFPQGFGVKFVKSFEVSPTRGLWQPFFRHRESRT